MGENLTTTIGRRWRFSWIIIFSYQVPFARPNTEETTEPGVPKLRKEPIVVHLVSYELQSVLGAGRPAFQYRQIAEVVKSIGPWCHIPESKWLVETELSTEQVAERIAPFTAVGDTIFVTRIYKDWYSYGLTTEQLNWMRERNYSSFFETLLSWLPLPKPIQTMTKLAPLPLSLFRR